VSIITPKAKSNLIVQETRVFHKYVLGYFLFHTLGLGGGIDQKTILE